MAGRRTPACEVGPQGPSPESEEPAELPQLGGFFQVTAGIGLRRSIGRDRGRDEFLIPHHLAVDIGLGSLSPGV